MKIRNLFHKGGSLADLWYKEKERKSRSWEIAEETTREEYTLDWSQSKVFLVTVAFSSFYGQLLEQLSVASLSVPSYCLFAGLLIVGPKVHLTMCV